MERNLLLAIALSILIIIGTQFYFQAVSPPPKKKPPVTTEQTQKPQKPQPGKGKSAEKKKAKPAGSAEKISDAQLTVAPARQDDTEAAAESLITVDSLKYEAVISSRGARIVSFKLKDFKEKLEGSELINLFEPDGVDSSGPSIIFIRRDATLRDSEMIYTFDQKDASVKLAEKGAKKVITFQATTSGGLQITKSYTFRADTYAVDFSMTFTNKSEADRSYLVTLPWRKAYRGEGSDRFAWNSAEILLDDELKDYYFTKIEGDEEPAGEVKWAGLGDVYFFKALVFGDKPAERVTLFKPTAEGIAEIRVRLGAVDLPAGQAVTRNLALYLGPKERSALLDAGHELYRAQFYSNNFLLEKMSEYLMKFLRFSHNGFEVAGIKIPGTGNWGIDIILLTILIKILFVPLTHKSMKSMKRMQDLQPEIAKLKEKHKDDKAGLNKATMSLFQEHKVNPLGGCWPIFLQLPVFIALYQTLSYAIELRHAEFLCIPSIYLCINDLSAPDPYYVTPILMGGTMVLQQWMTPSAGDPMQRKMMLFMPVVFTYLFLSFPSGLVLYWLVSNILSIAQQFLTNKMAN